MYSVLYYHYKSRYRRKNQLSSNQKGPNAPIRRQKWAESVKKYAGVDYDSWADDAAARADAAKHHIDVEENATKVLNK